MHFSEWNTDDSDAEDKAIENMCEENPDSTHKEPKYVHKGTQTSWLRLHPLNLGAESKSGDVVFIGGDDLNTIKEYADSIEFSQG